MVLLEVAVWYNLNSPNLARFTFYDFVVVVVVNFSLQISDKLQLVKRSHSFMFAGQCG